MVMEMSECFDSILLGVFTNSVKVHLKLNICSYSSPCPLFTDHIPFSSIGSLAPITHMNEGRASS